VETLNISVNTNYSRSEGNIVSAFPLLKLGGVCRKIIILDLWIVKRSHDFFKGNWLSKILRDFAAFS
jgi:hypothetical protein